MHSFHFLLLKLHIPWWRARTEYSSFVCRLASVISTIVCWSPHQHRVHCIERQRLPVIMFVHQPFQQRFKFHHSNNKTTTKRQVLARLVFCALTLQSCWIPHAYEKRFLRNFKIRYLYTESIDSLEKIADVYRWVRVPGFTLLSEIVVHKVVDRRHASRQLGCNLGHIFAIPSRQDCHPGVADNRENVSGKQTTRERKVEYAIGCH